MIAQSDYTLTLVNNGNSHRIDFPVGTLHVEDIGDRIGVVRSFTYNDNEYFLHETGTHPHTTAQKVVNAVAHAIGPRGSASAGAHLLQGSGKYGALIGALTGLGVYEIATHLPETAHSDSGYYNNGSKYFEGPVRVKLP